MEGIVKWFDCEKGFGFIERTEGSDVFVHYSQIAEQGYKTLAQGDSVRFELYYSQRGLQAQHVEKI